MAKMVTDLSNELNEVTKESQLYRKRRTPKRVHRGKFSSKTIRRIFDRDNYQCVRCGTYRNIESIPHHIHFKSQLGKGTEDNGVTVCIDCHSLAHRSREVRKWFEQYREERLLR